MQLNAKREWTIGAYPKAHFKERRNTFSRNLMMNSRGVTSKLHLSMKHWEQDTGRCPENALAQHELMQEVGRIHDVMKIREQARLDARWNLYLFQTFNLNLNHRGGATWGGGDC